MGRGKGKGQEWDEHACTEARAALAALPSLKPLLMPCSYRHPPGSRSLTYSRRYQYPRSWDP
jgi:hypothetical protein